MQTKHVYLALFTFAFFLVVLIAEYLGCSVDYRFVQSSDFLKVDLICGLSALVLFYLISRKAIKNAFQEKVPQVLIISFFLFFSFLLFCFFRFSIQLANGWWDPSDPQTHVADVTDRKVSVFGGSIKDGMNPTAHMLYLKDEDFGAENYEMLVTLAFYYSVDGGSRVEIALHPGFFHLPWVEAYQAVNGQGQ